MKILNDRQWFGRARFALDEEPTPAQRVDLRRRSEAELARMKAEMLAELLQTNHPDRHSLIDRAINDASALAWATPCPALMLPLLLEEKLEENSRYMERQQSIHKRFGIPCENAA